ncbi:M1 family metallopeptidase [Formosa sp. Hel3_A1_48]|uniref:M1 family metallopeptidase n=1 Tax=Formosa sp. Hel3_A1_48 TaxID=1336795 RepID=UPI00084E2EC8|nr:M1 family metallopeptidase [Formosa sp. Hel3_A1_48]
MRRTQIFILFFLLNTYVQSRAQKYSAQDTLRGSITPERIWWDLVYYDLDVTVQPKVKSIRGTNTIHYKVVSPNNIMQIDLQPPMKLIKAVQDEVELSINQNGNAHFIQLEKKQNRKKIEQIVLHFDGQPKEAINAPWDGGFSWKKDYNDNDFIATSCQGIGASVWWPNKDHMYDEVDSLQMKITVPKHLKAVGNGRLRAVTKNEKTASYTWFVSNPINNYGVNINIGDYVDFSETYNGEKGNLDMHYFVLKDNLNKAKKQFLDAPKMMKAFEYWFGPYPFYEDSYKLVEVPYLGMEHQSSITYGNQYKNGYLGRDLSGTGWGLKFDFIIIHESGHEWFANNITNKDIADMWIHEGFTAYSENLFLDYYYGKEASSEYVIGTRKRIRNDRPIIGNYNVNAEGSSDMYYKGANMIHMLRQFTKNDEKWRGILRKMNAKFHHQTVTTQQIESFLSDEIDLDLHSFFNQYLRDIRIPTLEYNIDKNILHYRWINVVEGFEMPIEFESNKQWQWLYPTVSWQTKAINSSTITVDEDYYITTKILKK